MGFEVHMGEATIETCKKVIELVDQKREQERLKVSKEEVCFTREDMYQ